MAKAVAVELQQPPEKFPAGSQTTLLMLEVVAAAVLEVVKLAGSVPAEAEPQVAAQAQQQSQEE
jgi:hypothetical protein